MDTINEVRLGVWQKQPAEFFERAVIDVDGTLAPTTGQCKEGMDIAYKGQWGYHPLLVSLANTAEPLYLVNRSGNRPSHDGAAPWLDIRVDRQKASLEGVSPESVAKMLEDYLTGQAEITREDLKQMVAVTARISGRDMGSTVRDVIGVLTRPGLMPKGVYYRMGGLYQEQQQAFRGLAIVLAAAVVLVFVLLLFLYESFRVAVAMMLTTLLAMAAVFIGLWLTGTELNITAMMGMTMIVGIVTEVAIIYYSEYAELPADTPVREGLILAGENRMRPIAMTTLAAILALMPLALGIGQGAAMQRPLAIAIISGLAVQLFLVLTVLPALLLMLGHRESRANHRDT